MLFTQYIIYFAYSLVTQFQEIALPHCIIVFKTQYYIDQKNRVAHNQL